MCRKINHALFIIIIIIIIVFPTLNNDSIVYIICIL